ncbi:hypothetical protein C0Q70_04028 [Pomacea canaliculata]|uniref:Uncharacterized protein n=1 Tax=Pomacea canaliculata TaxID=400727 RepID=A0A2T7PUD2_POMCA|nr:hypothetical protein C0Q70_04028 [Pomacea canaliculata]
MAEVGGEMATVSQRGGRENIIYGVYIMELGGCRGELEQDQKNNNEQKMSHCPVPGDSDHLPEVPAPATMGYLHLSFEYHRGILKIRVWQISDLLLPPPQISMIYSIFVRTYMIPDQAKKTNRQTEDVVVDSSSGRQSETPKTGIQHIFTPSSFKFSNPLLYTGVTPDIVKERSLQFEVCMTQKHSHRTFLMAMVHMPLRVAVRKPIREKYPLIPCMNITIPNNMRVYSARDLQLEVSNNRTDTHTRPSRLAPDKDLFPLSVQNARETDLEEVVSISGDDFLRSHLALCLDSDDDDDAGVKEKGQDLTEVVISAGVGSGGSSSTTLDMPSSDEEYGKKANTPNTVITTLAVEERSSVSISAVQTYPCNGSKKKIIPSECLRKIGLEDVSVTPQAQERFSDMKTSLSSEEYNADLSRSDVSEHVRKKVIPDKVPNFRLNFPNSEESCGASSVVSQQTEDDSESKSLRETAKNRHVVASQSNESVTKLRKVPELQKETYALEGANNASFQKIQSSSSPPTPRCSPTLELSPFPPSSRPETPVWDYYDFDDEGEPQIENNILEHSLRELQHSSHSLSLNPVLPMMLDDDFDTLDEDKPSLRPL